ncbi:hypothetical protein HSX11_27560 [Oxalobacteraceae bacterium]|nr:hypothetical protein [Oxalobacteraceae bacterium]
MPPPRTAPVAGPAWFAIGRRPAPSQYGHALSGVQLSNEIHAVSAIH